MDKLSAEAEKKGDHLTHFGPEGNLFEANYFPATGCDCWVKVWIYIDVYYDGDKVA